MHPLNCFSRALQSPKFCFAQIVGLKKHYIKQIKCLVDPKADGMYNNCFAIIAQLPHVTSKPSYDTFVKFHTTIAKPYIEELCEHLEASLGGCEVLQCFALFDPLSGQNTEAITKEQAMSLLHPLIKHFTTKKELVAVIGGVKNTYTFEPIWGQRNVDSIQEEIVGGLKSIREYKCANLAGVLSSCLKDVTFKLAFPSVSFLLELCGVFPLTTAGGERGFSRMKRVKHKLSKSIHDSRLSQVMLLGTECKYDSKGLDADHMKKIVDEFLQNSRRVEYCSFDTYMQSRATILARRRHSLSHHDTRNVAVQAGESCLEPVELTF